MYSSFEHCCITELDGPHLTPKLANIFCSAQASAVLILHDKDGCITLETVVPSSIILNHVSAMSHQDRQTHAMHGAVDTSFKLVQPAFSMYQP